MPRPLRVQAAGATYHVTCRGNRKQPIFLDANDRVFFQRWMGKVASDDEWEVFSFVQMTNHFHFTVRTPIPNISHGMQRLNGVYGQFFNDRHDFTGHVFQGRFHTRLVRSEAHLLECIRYDDLNPVRAGMVDHPLEWRWGSCRATAGISPKPDFLRCAQVLALFGSDVERARQKYVAFVESRLRDARRAA